MNNELYNKMLIIKKDLYNRDQKLREDFGRATTREEKKAIKEDVDLVDAKYHEVVTDIDRYYKESHTGIVSREFIVFETELAKKYGVNLDDALAKSQPVEVVNVSKPKKNHDFTAALCGVLAGAMLLGGGFFLGKSVKCNMFNRNETEITDTDNPSKTKPADDKCSQEATVEPEATPEVIVKPFDTYGDFTNVNDEEQLRARANWYYNTYLASSNRTGQPAVTIDELMDDIRIINGEFMRDAEGNPTYNDTHVIAVANDIHSIANYDSFTHYENQIYFTPTAPLFVDGSKAQQGAIELDAAMAKVVEAIRANNDEAFLAAAREWGTIVINIFNYVDFNGEHVNVYQVGAAEGFALYHAMSSKYASTILEYSEAHHLNVCVQYCVDYETNELREEALSQIMYNLNERAIDAVAVRSGNLPEYEADNLSLPQDLCLLAKDYFNSKYEIEIGHSRSLN